MECRCFKIEEEKNKKKNKSEGKKNKKRKNVKILFRSKLGGAVSIDLKRPFHAI